MTIGQRIKKIRLFRGMTQKELGNTLGFGVHGDIRIAPYESGVRTPKEQMLIKMADVLCVQPAVFSSRVCISKNDFMQSLFWMEESKGGGDIYDCIREWENMKSRYEDGEISEEEYFQWKLTYNSNPPTGTTV